MRRLPGLALAVIGLFAPVFIGAQASTLKIIGTDHLPVAYAIVAVEGANPSITNEQGEVSIGKRRNKALDVVVRRIGYRVLTERIDFPDKATTRTLTLSRVAQNPPPTAVNSAESANKLELAGFYSRWLQAQHDGFFSSFIGPEAIELRNASVTTDLLDRVVTLRVSGGIRSARGRGQLPRAGADVNNVASASANTTGECFMNVIVDKRPVCPNVGCHYVFLNDPPGSAAVDHSVDLDKLLSPKDIAGIELWSTSRRMPEFVKSADNGCGVIVIWTRR